MGSLGNFQSCVISVKKPKFLLYMSKYSPNFIDYIKIFCRSGSGGAGAVHFRREKFIHKGGPDGGNGGQGGHIIVRGNRNLWTLLHLKYRKHVHATNGKPGEGKCRSGTAGENVTVEVPLGTIIKEVATGKILAEIITHQEEKILFQGGKGGLGNVHFKSATKQTPRYAQPGLCGQEAWLSMELKILADVGLVGFPNAGKSTLLSVISAAKPKIANYPFTTLMPNIGMVAYQDDHSFVMADIPGIIGGASQGKGLGIRFLRHIERNAILLFVIPADSGSIGAAYTVLLEELKNFKPEILDKKRILAVSKSDLIDQEKMKAIKKDLPSIPTVFISSVTRYGINTLKNMIWAAIHTKSEL